MSDSDSCISYDDPLLAETSNNNNHNFEEWLHILEQNSKKLVEIKDKRKDLQELQDTDRARDDDINTRFSKIETRLDELEQEDDLYYPSDTYSFMALYGPIDKPIFFFFGFFVFVFQIALLLYMLLETVKEEWSSIEYHYDEHSDIAGDAETLVTGAQILAILASTLFLEASLHDITTTLKIFTSNHKTLNRCIIMSCIFRLIQGVLATASSFLLIITSTTVKNVVLYFAAINFISRLDGLAFLSAGKGYYGESIREETKNVTKARRTQFNNFIWVRGIFWIFLSPVLLLLCYDFFILRPQVNDTLLTQSVWVDFQDEDSLSNSMNSNNNDITSTVKSLTNSPAQICSTEYFTSSFAIIGNNEDMECDQFF